MTNIEANNMFYAIMAQDTDIAVILQGRTYNNRRSDGRETEECIVVNTPWCNHDRPQSGYSNINIHVPDMIVTIDGKEQLQPNLARLSTITSRVLAALDKNMVEGVSWTRPQETLMQETNHAEHYINLRIEWINCN